MKAGNSK